MKKMSGENILLLERRYRQATLLSLSLAGVLIAISITSFWIDSPVLTLDKEASDGMWIGIIFLAAGVFLIRRRFNRWDRFKDLHLLRGLDGVLRALKRDALLLTLLGFICGILGFVIFLSNASRYDLVRSVIVSFVLMGFVFPRKGIWKRIATELEGI